jgi:hypothetical protein
VDRGDTHREGIDNPDSGPRALEHVNYPYNARDVLLIASEGNGANKIEPVLTYARPEAEPEDAKVAPIGATNAIIQTSNGYPAHMFPEYITSLEYYYAAAPRPGFVSRFLVGENGVRAPYWPTSRTDFGGQIGASPGGDRPGDIYRLVGAVVLRDKGAAPQYAGYIASAIIVPGGTKNNRIVAPGSEDLVGPEGKPSRFFLVGLRPGTAFELGASLTPSAQVDPVLPAKIRIELTYPNGQVKAAQGAADAFGTFVGPIHWKLDVPGLYRYRIQGDWNGHHGEMPGLPRDGGFIFVLGRRPAPGDGIVLDPPDSAVFDPAVPLAIRGRSHAKKISFATLMPGAVLGQGELPVRNGWFTYTFDPSVTRTRATIYDSAKPSTGRVIHIVFFSEERLADGSSAWDLKRVMLRGNHIVEAD